MEKSQPMLHEKKKADRSDRKMQEAVIEAILFSMGSSVEVSRLAGVLDMGEDSVRELIYEMRIRWEEEGRGVTISEFEGAFQMCTCSEMYEYLIRIARIPRKYVLTDTLLETLSIIAYRQPVTKLDIEKIRGVNSDHAINRLVEYDLVMELGRMDAPGRPLLFGTTEQFLRSFGVKSLEGLPILNEAKLEEFKEEAEEEIDLRLSQPPVTEQE